MTEFNLYKTGGGDDVTIWYVCDSPRCSHCKEEILGYNAVFIVDWVKTEGRRDHLLHHDCAKYWVKHPLSVTQYRWQVLLSEIIPPKSTPVFVSAPAISESRSRVSVFEPEKIKSDTTKDNAWRSKRYESLEGAVVGDQDVLSKIQDKEVLIEQNPDAFLLEMQILGEKSAKELEERKKKLLEEHKQEGGV